MNKRICDFANINTVGHREPIGIGGSDMDKEKAYKKEDKNGQL